MLSTENQLESYWNWHSLDDGCPTTGFKPLSLAEILRDFTAERTRVLEFLKSPTEVARKFTELGEIVNPDEFPFGSVLQIDKESMTIERVRNNAQVLRHAFTLGLWQTNLPWDEPSYSQESYYGVVTSIDTTRGLITFNRSLLMSEFGASMTTGDSETTPIQIGEVTHSKLHQGIQANDRQIFKRVNQVILFA